MTVPPCSCTMDAQRPTVEGHRRPQALHRAVGVELELFAQDGAGALAHEPGVGGGEQSPHDVVVPEHVDGTDAHDRPDVPAALADVIFRCLARAPDDPCPSAAALAEALGWRAGAASPLALSLGGSYPRGPSPPGSLL